MAPHPRVWVQNCAASGRERISGPDRRTGNGHSRASRAYASQHRRSSHGAPACAPLMRYFERRVVSYPKPRETFTDDEPAWHPRISATSVMAMHRLILKPDPAGSVFAEADAIDEPL
jgi:hypothetical protein